MDKFSSQSNNNKNSDRATTSGTVTPIPLRARNSKNHPNEHEPQPDELQKDLELLARLREKIEQLPDIDTAKIVQLHEKIMRGEYQVNSKSLADKLSDFESDL